MKSEVNSSVDENICPDHITDFYLSNPNCRDPLGLAATQDHASVCESPKKLHSVKTLICLLLGSHNSLGPGLMQQDQVIPEHFVLSK